MPQLPVDEVESQPFVKSESDDRYEILNDDFEQNEEEAFTPRPSLPKAMVFMRKLGHIMKDLDTGVIDVEPEYQREVVWTADRMTGLINSLMENFYIPPIILNKKPRPEDADSPQKYTLICVDGKQRISSVRAFIKGMIPCHDHVGNKWYFSDAATYRRRKVLSEEQQKAFLNKEFVSFEYNDLSQEQEEDLFARVQMGVQLSVAEKMRASSGPWQELARLFVDDFPIVYSLMNERARAKDFQLTLACFSQIVEVMHPTASSGVPSLKTNFTALPKLLKNKAALDDGIKAHLASVWTTFKNLLELDPDVFTNGSKYLIGVQSFAPVETVAVAVLISMYSNTRNDRLLIGDIKALRVALRENFVDLRLNTTLWKFIWPYLEDMEAIRGAVDGSTMDRRVDVPVTTSAYLPSWKKNAKISTLTPKAAADEAKQNRKSKAKATLPEEPSNNSHEAGRNESSANTRPRKRPRMSSPLSHNENLLLSPQLPLGPPPWQTPDVESNLSPAILTSDVVGRSASHRAPAARPEKGKTRARNSLGVHDSNVGSGLDTSHSQASANGLQKDPPLETPIYRAPLVSMTGSSTSFLPQSEAPKLNTESAQGEDLGSGWDLELKLKDARGKSKNKSPSQSFAEDLLSNSVFRPTPPVSTSTQRLRPKPPGFVRRDLTILSLDNEGMVDLTGDVEQERQKLLSSFKSTVITKKDPPPQSPATHVHSSIAPSASAKGLPSRSITNS